MNNFARSSATKTLINTLANALGNAGDALTVDWTKIDLSGGTTYYPK